MKRNSAEPMVISYLRFSTAEQLHGDSTRRQTKMAEDWCQRNNRLLTDRLSDKGISAFRGKNAKEGALAAFLELVKGGTVPKGSILLVEDLDRVSRQQPETSIALFLQIVSAGVTVVTLRDQCEYRSGQLDMGKLMQSVMRFCLAHEESAKKSQRLSEAWKGKRLKIAKTPLTSLVPHWLIRKDDKIVVDEPKVDIVRRIFQMVMDGYGLTAICKKMNETAKGMARVKHWQRSYISKILHSRAVIGEFQPHQFSFTGGKKSRVPVGDAIGNYYPAVVDEQTFYAVQKMLASRRTTGGRNSGWTNLFSGLIFDYADKSSLQTTNKSKGKRYASSAAILGIKGHSPYIGMPVDAFEAAFFYRMNEYSDYSVGAVSGDNLQKKMGAVQARIDEVEAKIEKITEQAMTDAIDSGSVVKLLGKLDAQLKDLRREQQELKGRLAVEGRESVKDAIDECYALMHGAMEGKPLDNDKRIKLKGLIQRLVKRIDCSFERHGCFKHPVYDCGCFVTMFDGSQMKYGFRTSRDENGNMRLKLVEDMEALAA